MRAKFVTIICQSLLFQKNTKITRPDPTLNVTKIFHSTNLYVKKFRVESSIRMTRYIPTMLAPIQSIHPMPALPTNFNSRNKQITGFKIQPEVRLNANTNNKDNQTRA